MFDIKPNCLIYFTHFEVSIRWFYSYLLGLLSFTRIFCFDHFTRSFHYAGFSRTTRFENVTFTSEHASFNTTTEYDRFSAALLSLLYREQASRPGQDVKVAL